MGSEDFLALGEALAEKDQGLKHPIMELKRNENQKKIAAVSPLSSLRNRHYGNALKLAAA